MECRFLWAGKMICQRFQASLSIILYIHNQVVFSHFNFK